MTQATPLRQPPRRIYAAGPSISDLDIELVQDALVRGAYEAPYHYVERFQDEFAKHHGRRFAIMTPNCTTAIHLTMAGLGITGGDEVIVPELTWIGSTAGIHYVGAKTVFADVRESDWCLDPESVQERITPNTKAIVAVGLHGNMPDLPALQAIADEHDLHLIEDAAQSLGSTLNGKKAGSFGKASVFSFHRTKTLSTVEGGMMVTDDEALWDRCMFLRDHGRSRTKTYYIDEIAFKYIPTNLQAALDCAQLERIDELVAKKRQILKWYRAKLADLPDIQLNPEPSGGINAAWVTGLVFGASYGPVREAAINHMETWGLPGRPFFYPLSSLPAYDDEATYRPLNPVAYNLYQRGINLPGALNMEEDEADYIADCLHEFVRSAGS